MEKAACQAVRARTGSSPDLTAPTPEWLYFPSIHFLADTLSKASYTSRTEESTTIRPATQWAFNTWALFLHMATDG